MWEYNELYWLYIIGGNVCYFLILLVWRILLKKSKVRNIGLSLLMTVLTGVVIILTSRLEMRLPHIISGRYGDAPWGVRLAAGIACSLVYIAFIPCYQFVVLKLKLYLRRDGHHVAYVYHDNILLVSVVVWFMLLWCQMFMTAALVGFYKPLYDWIYWGLQILCYIGGIGLMLLRQKTFVVTGNNYSYKGFNKSFDGRVEDIHSVEEIRGGVILHTDSAAMRIKCSQKPYIDLLNDKLSGGGSEE